MRANPSIRNPNLIHAGQRLNIPGSTDRYAPVAPSTRRAGSYVVRSGDTLGGIAQRHGTSVGAIASLNGIQNPNLIDPGQVLQMPGGAPAPTAPSTPRPTGHIYSVRPGDTLSGIASRFGVSMNAL